MREFQHENKFVLYELTTSLALQWALEIIGQAHSFLGFWFLSTRRKKTIKADRKCANYAKWYLNVSARTRWHCSLISLSHARWTIWLIFARFVFSCVLFLANHELFFVSLEQNYKEPFLRFFSLSRFIMNIRSYSSIVLLTQRPRLQPSSGTYPMCQQHQKGIVK